MLIIILSEDLKLRFISPDSSVSFRPYPAHLDQSIDSSERLMEVDPGLSLDCRSALRGGQQVLREIADPCGNVFLRRIMIRTTGDGQKMELVVSYEAGGPALALELALLRKQLVSALDSVQDPIAYYDTHDCLIHYNQAYARLHNSEEGEISAGMRFEDILRRNLRNGLLGLPVEQHEQWLRDQLTQRERHTFEKEMRFYDGRWFRVTEQTTARGSRVHMLVDITELKTIQISLEQVIAGSHAATWTVNLETGESIVNDRWAQMLGLDKQTVASIGFNGWRTLVHPDDVAAAEAGFLECLEGSAATFEADYRLRHQFGHWIWVMGRGGITDRHADGRPYKISGVLLDISRQKELEAELAMQAAAISATDDGITITDEAGTILFTNSAHASMFGYDEPESLIGQPWYSLYSSQAAARLAADAFPALRTHGTWRGKAEALRTDGKKFEQELSLTVMPDGRIICINRDVSARNAIERERLQIRDRIEVAQRREIVNLLAAGLTHDLSNLITIISHNSDPALEKTGVRLPQSFKNIHSAARHAIALLEPIRSLEIDRLDNKETDLVGLIKEAKNVLQLGVEYDLTITADLPEEPVTATVDPLKFMQVLLNLGLNARDALGEGEQQITLSLSVSDTIPHTADLQLGEIPNKPYALIRISDTGTGIVPEVRARLWEPHFTTKGNMGTGLGLPVVAEIVREAGGAIALDTSLGVGSSFYVAWPLYPPVVQKTRVC